MTVEPASTWIGSLRHLLRALVAMLVPFHSFAQPDNTISKNIFTANGLLWRLSCCKTDTR